MERYEKPSMEIVEIEEELTINTYEEESSSMS